MDITIIGNYRETIEFDLGIRLQCTGTDQYSRLWSVASTLSPALCTGPGAAEKPKKLPLPPHYAWHRARHVSDDAAPPPKGQLQEAARPQQAVIPPKVPRALQQVATGTAAAQSHMGVP